MVLTIPTDRSRPVHQGAAIQMTTAITSYATRSSADLLLRIASRCVVVGGAVGHLDEQAAGLVDEEREKVTAAASSSTAPADAGRRHRQLRRTRRLRSCAV